MSNMSKFGVFALVASFACSVQASWYWPFGSDESDDEPARISELMEPASLLIDEASDLAEEGKVDESVEKYRKALLELDRIEMENPDRASSAEFATLRNKRAYVNAAIDSMLLSQVKSNAKAVAISDTTELEKKLAEERAAKTKREEPSKDNKTAPQPTQPPQPSQPRTPREEAMQAIAKGAYEEAERQIETLLAEKPKSAVALNLRAALRTQQGKFKEAEEALDEAIVSNPRNYFAYYNMAKLLLQMRPEDPSVAKRYYETGRAVGGPADAALEAVFR